MSEIVTNNRVESMTEDLVKRATQTPLQLIPQAWRLEAWQFWAMWQHVMPNQIPLAMRIRAWIKDHDITFDELQQIFAVINRPAIAAGIRFPGDLFGELSKRVSEIIAKRQSIRSMLELRHANEQAANSIDPQQIKDMVSSLADSMK